MASRGLRKTWSFSIWRPVRGETLICPCSYGCLVSLVKNRFITSHPQARQADWRERTPVPRLPAYASGRAPHARQWHYTSVRTHKNKSFSSPHLLSKFPDHFKVIDFLPKKDFALFNVRTVPYPILFQSTLKDNLLWCKPTQFVGVPRVYEKVQCYWGQKTCSRVLGERSLYRLASARNFWMK